MFLIASDARRVFIKPRVARSLGKHTGGCPCQYCNGRAIARVTDVCPSESLDGEEKISVPLKGLYLKDLRAGRASILASIIILSLLCTRYHY